MTLLPGLSEIDWAALSQAYGPATEVPEMLRPLVDSDPVRARAALHELWGTVWHQGTVYDCTPVVVPFLVQVVQAKDVDDRTRAEVALLLASIASASSFVLGGRPTQMWPAEWRRGPDQQVPARDLVRECNLAVAASLERLAPVFGAAPRATRAGLVALAAAVAEHLPIALREQLAALAHDNDAKLAVAAQLTGELAAGQCLTYEHLAELAAVDGDALDDLSSDADSPLRRRAIALAQELAISAIG